MRLRTALLVAFSFTASWAAAADVGVRIRFGLTDTGNTAWDGSVAVTPGKVESIDGWRFEQADKVIDANSWKASTRPLSVRRSNNAKKKAKANPKGGGLLADNGVFVMLRDVTEASVVKVRTEKGDFDFPLSAIPYGKVVEKLGGNVDLERVAFTEPLSTQRDDDDYPSIAVDKSGAITVAWVSFTPGLDRDERAKRLEAAPSDFSYLAKPAGGDRIWVRQQNNGKWSEPIAVTTGGADIY